MDRIGELLDEKGRNVWTIDPDAMVLDAIRLMAEKGIGALAVVDADRMVGIMSERDYARKLVLEGKSSRDTPVRDIMTLRVIYAQPQQTVEECMATMTENRIRHMPVLEDDTLIGMLSLGDLVKVIISKQKSIIEELETYIMG